MPQPCRQLDSVPGHHQSRNYASAAGSGCLIFPGSVSSPGLAASLVLCCPQVVEGERAPKITVQTNCRGKA